MTRKCPRCKLDLDPIEFQDPVSICIVCYSMIPENKGLNIAQLRNKMFNSVMARRRTRAKQHLDNVQALFGSTNHVIVHSKIVSGPNEIDMSDDDPDDPFRPNAPKLTCPLCHSEVPEFLIINGAILLNGRRLPGICHMCMDRKQEWEHAAAQGKSEEQVVKTEGQRA